MKTITRKEIAIEAGVSVRTVCRRANEWGIEKYRSKASRRPAAYFRSKIMAKLRSLGIIDEI